MISYCWKFRNYPESKNTTFAKTNKGKPMVLPKFTMCGSNK